MAIEDFAVAAHDQSLPPGRNERPIGFDDQTSEGIPFHPVRPKHLHDGIIDAQGSYARPETFTAPAAPPPAPSVSNGMVTRWEERREHFTHGRQVGVHCGSESSRRPTIPEHPMELGLQTPGGRLSAAHELSLGLVRRAKCATRTSTPKTANG